MSDELLKYLSPLLGVGFGALIAPYIDFMRSKKESKYAVSCFYSELFDYLEDAPEYVRAFHDCYMKSKKVEMGIIKKDEQLFPVRFYPSISFLTINNLIEKSFLDLTKDQRKAVKALNLIAISINESTDYLSKLQTIEDFKDSKSEFVSATRTSASLYYLLSRLTREKERFVYFDSSKKDICNEAMSAIGLSFDQSIFEDKQQNN